VTALESSGEGAGGGAATARNSVTVAGWTLVSRVTGLLRVVVIGAVLGPTYFANCFQASNVVPNIVFSLLLGPVLAMVLVPALVGALGTGGRAGASALLGRVTGWLVVAAGGVVALLVVISPGLAWTLSAGIPDAAERGRGLWLTTLLLVLLAPQILLYCLAHVGLSAQRACGRFALSAAAPAVENVVLIGTVLFAGWYFDAAGIGIDRVPLAMVVVLGAGSTVAVGLHAALQLFGAARVGLLAWPALGWRAEPAAAAVTRRLARSVGVVALPALAMYPLLAIAGSVPGGVFVVQISYAVLFALSYVGARAVSMASLSELADAAHRADLARFGASWRRGLSYALVAGLPLLVLLAVLCGPTSDILATGELRHADLTGPLAACLAVVAVAQLVTGLGDLGSQALFARLEDRVPRRASRVTLAVTVLVGAGALLVPAGGGRLVWLVVAILAGELAAAAMVLGRARVAIRPERFVDRRALAAALLATVAMAPVAAATWWVQHTYADGQLAVLGVLVAGGLLAVTGYALVLRASWPR
jgi:peptidoglycan biosynthesis protein MviN/MurJ (putative lipid II flippase)